jgi:hypothetical protein
MKKKKFCTWDDPYREEEDIVYPFETTKTYKFTGATKLF